MSGVERSQVLRRVDPQRLLFRGAGRVPANSCRFGWFGGLGRRCWIGALLVSTNLALAAVLVSVVASPARAEEITLGAMRDNTLFLDPKGGTSNGSGPVLFAGNNSQSNTRRALVFFDVSMLGVDVSVEEVELRLTVTNAPGSDPTTIAVHRLQADWGEGASSSGGGTGAPAEFGDATWIHRFYPDSTWLASGGDFDPSASATVEVGAEGTFVWTGEELVRDVESWIHGTAGNYGWVLVGDESNPSTARRFGSRENEIPEVRPELTIRFVHLSPVLEKSWGTIKSVWSDPQALPSARSSRE